MGSAYDGYSVEDNLDVLQYHFRAHFKFRGVH
jgi:hypothetical protein